MRADRRERGRRSRRRTARRRSARRRRRSTSAGLYAAKTLRDEELAAFLTLIDPNGSGGAAPAKRKREEARKLVTAEMRSRDLQRAVLQRVRVAVQAPGGAAPTDEEPEAFLEDIDRCGSGGRVAEEREGARALVTAEMERREAERAVRAALQVAERERAALAALPLVIDLVASKILTSDEIRGELELDADGGTAGEGPSPAAWVAEYGTGDPSFLLNLGRAGRKAVEAVPWAFAGTDMPAFAEQLEDRLEVLKDLAQAPSGGGSTCTTRCRRRAGGGPAAASCRCTSCRSSAAPWSGSSCTSTPSSPRAPRSARRWPGGC